MEFFSVPSNLLALAAVVSLVLFVIRPRIGSIVMALSLAAIAVVALGPLGNVLLTPLEQRFPERVFPAQGLEGIIVLAGSYDYVRHAYLSTIVLEDVGTPKPRSS